VTFESGSKLSRIEACAFWRCSALSYIRIPSSVEILCVSCFCECSSLSTVTFELGSQLSWVESHIYMRDSGGFTEASALVPFSVENFRECFVER
jgi:hypothetical protein